MTNNREQWFLNQVGKVVYRTKTTCECYSCELIYARGVKVKDQDHAKYLWDFEMEMDVKYFETIKERDEYERQNE